MNEEIDASGLPPLPAPTQFVVRGLTRYVYTAEQVRQGQRDAVAADRSKFPRHMRRCFDEIADLRAQLATLPQGGAELVPKSSETRMDTGFHPGAESAAAPTQPKAQAGASIDTPEFQEKLNDLLCEERANKAEQASEVDRARAEFIAHIDAWAGSRAGDAVPIAWARKWHVDGEVPAKEKNASGRWAWPQKFKVYAVTPNKIFKDDVPLVAATAPGKQAGKEE